MPFGMLTNDFLIRLQPTITRLGVNIDNRLLAFAGLRVQLLQSTLAAALSAHNVFSRKRASFFFSFSSPLCNYVATVLICLLHEAC